MTAADTDKQAKKDVTVADLIEAVSGKGKRAGWLQSLLIVVSILTGTGIGQRLFGVDKETLREELKKETAPIVLQLTALQAENAGMKERLVRLETKLDK